MIEIKRQETESKDVNINYGLIMVTIRLMNETDEGRKMLRWIACDLILIRNDLRDDMHFCEEVLADDLRSVILDHIDRPVIDWRIEDLRRVSQVRMCDGLKHDPHSEVIDELYKLRVAMCRKHGTGRLTEKRIGEALYLILHRIFDFIEAYAALGDRMYLAISEDQESFSAMFPNTIEKIKKMLTP